MSDLRERLALLGVLPAPEVPDVPDVPDVDPGASRLAGVAAPPDRAERAQILAEALPGAVAVGRAEGWLVELERRLPADARLGDVSLDAFAGPVPDGLARLGGDPRAAGAALHEAVCLDVETTGLGFGAGTYAFLVGLLGPCPPVGEGEGEREGASVGGGISPRSNPGRGLRLWQGLIADPADEPALLARLAEVLADAALVVTFNGRRFDLPLLHGRHVLHQRAFSLQAAPHLDMLGPARRIYRQRLGSCALARLQAHVLGAPREGDIPGAEIPDLYRAFLALGAPAAAPLAEVARHNAQDLEALAALTIRIQRTLDPEDPREPVHGGDWLGLARCRRVLGDDAAALQDHLAAWERLTAESVRAAAAAHDAGALDGPPLPEGVSGALAPDHPALVPADRGRRAKAQTTLDVDPGPSGATRAAGPWSTDPGAAHLHVLAGAAGLELARLHRRGGDLEAALRIWEALRAAGQGDVGPMVELAKIAEHGRRDFAGALALVEDALAGLAAGAFPDLAKRGEAIHDLRHRRDRLRRRLARAGGTLTPAPPDR